MANREKSLDNLPFIIVMLQAIFCDSVGNRCGCLLTAQQLIGGRIRVTDFVRVRK